MNPKLSLFGAMEIVWQILRDRERVDEVMTSRGFSERDRNWISTEISSLRIVLAAARAQYEEKAEIELAWLHKLNNPTGH